MGTYKIVVTTLGLIGRYQDKYQPDIVFVDEAAQACEPEADCAIGVLSGKNIILAGDPKQLGPFSSSKVAEQYGFGEVFQPLLISFYIILIHRHIFARTAHEFKSISRQRRKIYYHA